MIRTPGSAGGPARLRVSASSLDGATHSRRSVRGASLLESLIALLVFAAGLLTVIAMYAFAMRNAGDAQYRAEAATYGAELLQAIQATVARNPDGGVVRTGGPTALDSFRLNAAGGTSCDWQGGAGSSAPGALEQWLRRIDADRTGLPGAAGAGAKRVTVGDATSFNRVVVSICWQAPGAMGFSRHEISGYVN